MVRKIIVTILVALFILPFSVNAGRSSGDTSNARKFESYYGLLPDQATQKRIADLGDRLVEENGLPKEDFTFKVINSAEVNAVTLPGGYIYVYKGLIDFMPSDDEIAAVIGHEIGHVMGNHIARRQREQLLTTIIGAILGGPEAAIAANAALASLPAYSQRDEREADDSGFKYMVGADMNPYAILVVMHKLGETSNPQIKSNFASHPEPLERAARIDKYLQKMQIQPKVTSGKNSAIVQDGAWSFEVKHSDGANIPLYRAWLLAGNLYCVSLEAAIVKEKFIVVEDKNNANIYYGDRLVYTVTPIDVMKDGAQSVSQKAAEYIETFRLWADIKSKS